MPRSNRILLVGCGAIGNAVAASLIKAGHDLTLVTGNARIREGIEQEGLRVQELDGTTWSVRPLKPPVEHAAELKGQEPFDLCLLATKTTTLSDALKEVEPLLRPSAQVVCMQNGLPEERAAEIFGPQRVIGCIVGFGASMGGPALSVRTSSGSFQLGRPFGGTVTIDEALREVADVLKSCAEVRLVDNLASVRWSKLAINCATSTLGAAGGDTLGRLLSHRFVRRLALEVWTEVSRVAAKSGVRMAKVAGTLDIASLALSDTEKRLRYGSPALFYKHSMLYLVGLKFRRMRSSMLVALERGRKPEIDWLNGEVVRRGDALAIPTPVNSGLVRLIHEIEAGKARPSLETLASFFSTIENDESTRAILSQTPLA